MLAVCTFQTVEDASEKAAATAFGRSHNVPSRRQHVGRTIRTRVEDAQIHEAAYAEGLRLFRAVFACCFCKNSLKYPQISILIKQQTHRSDVTVCL